MRTFLGGHRELFVDPCKEIFEDLDAGVGIQEVICGASNYYNVFGRFCLKVIESMVYDTLDKT